MMGGCPTVRRGRTTSTRSTASGGVRRSVIEMVPERANDMMEKLERRNRERVQDIGCDVSAIKLLSKERRENMVITPCPAPPYPVLLNGQDIL